MQESGCHQWYSPGWSGLTTVTWPTFFPLKRSNSSPLNSKPCFRAILATSSAVDAASTVCFKASSFCMLRMKALSWSRATPHLHEANTLPWPSTSGQSQSASGHGLGGGWRRWFWSRVPQHWNRAENEHAANHQQHQQAQGANHRLTCQRVAAGGADRSDATRRVKHGGWTAATRLATEARHPLSTLWSHAASHPWPRSLL